MGRGRRRKMRVLTLYRRDGCWWHRRNWGRDPAERRTPFGDEVDGQALARGYAEDLGVEVVVEDAAPLLERRARGG